MCLTGGALTVALVTAHVPLREVAMQLSAPEIVRVGGLLADFVLRRKGARPRLAVAGLNPHAGESGALMRIPPSPYQAPSTSTAGKKNGSAEDAITWSTRNVHGRLRRCGLSQGSMHASACDCTHVIDCPVV